ncbi:MAG: hypothetical protein HN904_19660, partial [Victivallales bacterium]|nr:hypothetical protein [Victivallales bacterium]
MHPRRTAHLLSRVVLMVLLSAPFLVVSAQDAKPATDKDAKAVEETPAEPQPEMEPSVPEMEEEVIGSVSPAERMKQGGKTMLFLLALSVIALTFSLER